MAELTQTEIETQLTAIDAAIAAIITTMAAGGQGAAALNDYSIGAISVSGSQRLEQLQKTREMYQALLEKIPTVAYDVASYDINRDGRDLSDLRGDE